MKSFRVWHTSYYGTVLFSQQEFATEALAEQFIAQCMFACGTKRKSYSIL